MKLFSKCGSENARMNENHRLLIENSHFIKISFDEKTTQEHFTILIQNYSKIIYRLFSKPGNVELALRLQHVQRLPGCRDRKRVLELDQSLQRALLPHGTL